MLIQFKYLSFVSAYFWNCLGKFIIVFRDRGTGPHFEPDECSAPPPRLSPTSYFFIIHFNSPLSPIQRDKLRVVQFCKTFLLFRPSACVLDIVDTLLLKHFVCTFVSRVET